MSESKLDPIEEYFLHVGFLSAYRNKAEEELDDLLTCLVGDGKKAHIIIGSQPASKRLGYAEKMIQQCFANEDWKDAALSALAAFDTLRKNRNVIIHGIATRLDLPTGVIALRASTHNQTTKTYKHIEVTHKDVVNELEYVIALGRHLNAVRRYAFPNGPVGKLADLLSGPPSLPKKFPTPTVLQSTPNPNPKKQKAPPQSSEG